MGKSKRYKIRLKSKKIIGPMEAHEVNALIVKGKISGKELVRLDSEVIWRPFSYFPQLQKMLNQHLSSKAAPSLKNFLKKDEKKFWESIPTLVNIPHQKKQDLEKTKVTDPAHKALNPFISGERTKIIQASRTSPIQKSKGAKGSLDEKLNISSKKRILSKKTIIIITIGLLILLLFQNEEQQSFIESINPKIHQFARLQTQPLPKTKKDKIDIGRSGYYLEESIKYYNSGGPNNHIKTAKLLYKSLYYNPKNIIARSLLASTYIRLSEIIPRNEALYKNIISLLEMNKKAIKKNTPEYLIAKAEFFLMLNQNESALRLIESTIKTAPNPELLYLASKIYKKRGEINRAISLITRAIKLNDNPEKAEYKLLYAKLLVNKKQIKIAIKILKTSIKNKLHGDSIYELALLSYKSGDIDSALKASSIIIERPWLVDKLVLSKVFLLTARIFEFQKMYKKALLFARSIRHIVPYNQEADDLIFRVKSKAKSKRTKKLYQYLIAAKEREKTKEYKKAIDLYIRARETDRYSPEPLYRLARLYETIGEPQKATRLYERLTKMSKKKLDAYFRLADLYITKFELDKAKAMMRVAKSALRRSPSTPRITHMLGKIALRQKRRKTAKNFFVRAIEEDSRDPKLYVDMGKLEMKRKAIELAEFHYSSALRYDPFNSEALFGVATSRFYLNSPNAAVRFLKNKLYASPGSSKILTSLATIYLKSGDKKSGKLFLQRAIQNNPYYIQAYKLMGDLVKKEGDLSTNFYDKRKSYQFALASYKKYSKLAPNEPDGFMAMAELYFFIRDLGSAAKNYNKVLRIAPNYPKARIQLAKIAMNGESPETALSLVKEEIKRHPNSSEAYLELGKIKLAKEEFSSSKKALQTAIQINSKNTDAIIYLGYVYYLGDSFQNAIALFKRALEISPARADIHWKLGLAYEQHKNYSQAIIAYKNYRGLTNDREEIIKANKRIQRLGGG